MEVKPPNFVVIDIKPDFRVLGSPPKAVEVDPLLFDQLIEEVKEVVPEVEKPLVFDQPVEVGESQAPTQQVDPLYRYEKPTYIKPNKRRWFWWR